jgi:hypothetical protein
VVWQSQRRVLSGFPKLTVILTLLTADSQYNECNREQREKYPQMTFVKPGAELWLGFVKQGWSLVTEALLEL